MSAQRLILLFMNCFQRNGNCRSSRNRKAIDWRQRCREILEAIWNSGDSVPFREPVDTLEHPGKFSNYKTADEPHFPQIETDFVCSIHSDYLTIIDTPMDLRTIKEDLLGGNYESAKSFIKDMRRIFSNSRSYNTNRNSRVRFQPIIRLSVPSAHTIIIIIIYSE